MKVIVAGSRDFNDYGLLEARLNHYFANLQHITIVSGAARGADQLGERYAEAYGHDISSHPADWDQHGKSAGYIRNEEMAKEADALVAFWDGNSRGTKHMIDLAKKYNLKLRVVLIEK